MQKRGGEIEMMSFEMVRGDRWIVYDICWVKLHLQCSGLRQQSEYWKLEISYQFNECTEWILFLKEPVKLDPWLAVLKIFMIFRVYLFLICYFFFFFSFFFFKLVKNHGTKIIYTFQFVLMSCSRHFVLMSCLTASLVLFLAFYFFPQNQGFCSYKFFFFFKVYLMLTHLLSETNIFIRSVFRTQSRIYGRTFFAKIVNN